MADETATLKDTLVSDAPTTTETVDTPTTPTEELKAPRILDAPDPAAEKLGTILLQSGWTEDKINDLLQAPAALESLKYTIQNNPQEFLNMVERADPKSGEVFLEKMADTYVQRYGDRDGGGKPDKSGDSALLREVETLREKTNRLEAREQSREQAIALQAARQRYDARVDDLFGQVKDLGLKPSEAKNIKARIDVELAKDPSATARVSRGNFVDVARVFQSVVDELVSDKKAAIQAEKDQREGVQRNAFSDFSLGPQANIPPDLLEKASGSWDDTEAALAKALTGAR